MISWESMFQSLDDIVSMVEVDHEYGLMPGQIEAMKQETEAMRAKWKVDKSDGPVALYMRAVIASLQERQLQVKGKRNADGRFDRRDDAFVKIIKAISSRNDSIVSLDRDKSSVRFAVDQTIAKKMASDSNVSKLAVKLASNMRTRCIGTEIPVAIDGPYILDLLREQRMMCAISGIPFRFDARVDGQHRNPFAPSLDRIINRLGYVPGNVRITLVSVNIGINEWGAAHYREVAEAVVKKDAFEMKSKLMTGWRFSTEPFHVWDSPNLTDIPEDAILNLEQAVFLPILNQNFLPRELWAASVRGDLKTTKPTGKMIFTTQRWVREWVAKWDEQGNRPAYGTAKASGTSSTAASKSALVSARNAASRLRTVSRSTSKLAR